MTETPLDHDPLVDELPSRYIVGIDLGTTNCAVTYIDTEESPWQIRVFPIQQVVAPNEVEARDTLPSFHYQPTSVEVVGKAIALPWQTKSRGYTVGVFAQEGGTKTSGRVISSAKSWLSHAGVDRTANILPWHGADDVERYSPVEVSASYLQHIREAWDSAFQHCPLAEQDIVITLPASFDEVARELTVKAAAQANLSRVVLIEEPQAAFYAWVHKHASDWESQVSPGQKILVCDIGGGTSDFTLIRVRRSDPQDDAGSKVQFHRIAVGDHLILGGDNLDLTLAKFVEPKISKGKKLSSRQWDMLLSRCRHVKEQFLSDNPPEKITVNLPGEGTKLIGGGLHADVSSGEVHELLIDGFLPEVSLNAKPSRKQSGFQEFGLPYASDAGITRYLAAFLLAHRNSDGQAGEDSRESDAKPDIVLFNGGFFESPQLRQRIVKAITDWFRDGSDWQPQILDNDRLDLAVARGAAYYGMVRRGEGVRIAASLARSYYIGVQDSDANQSAVCLVPGNAEPGQSVKLDRRFTLAISQPVEFPIFVSSTRLTDAPGSVVPVDLEQMRAMPPIRTVLRIGRQRRSEDISVQLHVQLTEIGTIELSCQQVDSGRSWRLQFDIRNATQTDVAMHQATGETEGFIDDSTWSQCESMIRGVFGEEGNEKPGTLTKQLNDALGSHRDEWPMSLLRRIWESLMELESGRRKSASHEARWLNLLGFALRPGFGMAVDDWRVTETWRHVRGKLSHRSANIQAESLILWRRLAGGLSAGQQLAIAEPYVSALRGLHRQSTTGKASSSTLKPEETAEVWRLLGSLELLSMTQKITLGKMIVDLLPKRRYASVREPMVWALGRLGQRMPMYGPLNSIVPPETTEKWLRTISTQSQLGAIDHLAVMQICRRTGDRHRDVSESTRNEIAGWLEEHNANPHLVMLVQEVGELDQQEQGAVFGEALPQGLRIQ